MLARTHMKGEWKALDAPVAYLHSGKRPMKDVLKGGIILLKSLYVVMLSAAT